MGDQFAMMSLFSHNLVLNEDPYMIHDRGWPIRIEYVSYVTLAA